MTINVGDLITAYHKGYHIVTKIINTPHGIQLEYTKCLDDNGNPSRQTKNGCHIDYCRKIDRMAADSDHMVECSAAAKKLNNILDVLDKIDYAKSKTDETM